MCALLPPISRGYKHLVATICSDSTVRSSARKIIITARTEMKAIEINLRSCHRNENRKQIRGVKSKSLNSFGHNPDFPSEGNIAFGPKSKTQ